MVFRLEHTFIIAATFLLNIELCFCACARAEYEINGECCPMCAPGSRVYRHCTEFVSTTCVPCVDSTFTSEPNGLLNCRSCAVCDPGQGLRVKTACARTSDTVCEPLEGFYCTNDDQGSCTQAVEHTKCSPGQYIKQKGTAHKDAECAGCKNGTYSDGSLEICKQHTQCEDLGLTEIKPGTTMSDVLGRMRQKQVHTWKNLKHPPHRQHFYNRTALEWSLLMSSLSPRTEDQDTITSVPG
ncbi:hypothetical protein PDJAM_G00239400 [Pangasius djambal]|uniref:Uncharacterized protein n=1 Tax=Pangasius djambal TaxID=1691987 RepID=A0ACC5YGR7_9TELE|nr:hypothetical protein [Pangasius djambal]